MRCSNCGKDVPFAGRVCPYCRADKSDDKALYAVATVCMVTGGVLGWVTTGGVFLSIVTAVLSSCLGAIGVGIVHKVVPRS